METFQQHFLRLTTLESRCSATIFSRWQFLLFLLGSFIGMYLFLFLIVFFQEDMEEGWMESTVEWSQSWTWWISRAGSRRRTSTSPTPRPRGSSLTLSPTPRPLWPWHGTPAAVCSSPPTSWATTSTSSEWSPIHLAPPSPRSTTSTPCTGGTHRALFKTLPSLQTPVG